MDATDTTKALAWCVYQVSATNAAGLPPPTPGLNGQRKRQQRSSQSSCLLLLLLLLLAHNGHEHVQLSYIRCVFILRREMTVRGVKRGRCECMLMRNERVSGWLCYVGSMDGRKLSDDDVHSSVQFCSGWYICVPSRLSEVSPTLPLKRFQCSSDRRWPCLVL